MGEFVHLRVTSCYSFLRAAGRPDAYLARAVALGYDALALCEDDHLGGLLRFENGALAAGLRPVLGATVTTPAGPLSFLCRDREGYRRLCGLVSAAHLGAVRGEPCATLAAVEAAAGEGLVVLTGGRRGRLAERVRRGDLAGAAGWLDWLAERFGRGRVVVELQRLGWPGDERLSLQLADLARRQGLRYAATADVRFVHRADFPTYDLMHCIRRLKTVDEAFAGRPINDLQYLCGPEVMARRFADLPEALRATVDIAADCAPLRLDGDRYVPDFNGVARDQHAAVLADLARAGMRRRYPRREWPAVGARIDEELRIIGRLGLNGYFLLVWELCRWAQEQGIRCAGRGSAAGSVVCYCLRITQVDAWARQITVARFLNEERHNSLPDIDVDFDRAGRDRVIGHVLDRYGVEQVAMTGTFVRYHARLAIRDVGRALAMPQEDIDRLAGSLPRLHADQIEEAMATMPDVRHSPWAESRYRLLRRLVPAFEGLPRYLGTHLGGVIVAPLPLSETVGLQYAAKRIGGQPLRVVQGDKEDVEARLCKLDLLSLPMLGVLHDASGWVRRRRPGFEIDEVPLDDAATFARLRRSETIGAFEVGSPAQRALHSQLDCHDMEPLVAALALIRPGPVQGQMGPRYLARRLGREPVTYWLSELEPALARTYGVLIYQEQVIDVARLAAGLTPAEGDLLRRSISHYRSAEQMTALGADLQARMVARGVAGETAAEITTAIMGFAGYGFCESHAAAFAVTAYRSVYLLEHYPAEYIAALLRHQPMGFYPVHTLVEQVRVRGVEVRPPCLRGGPARTEAVEGAIRIGLAQVRHITPTMADQLVARRPYRSLGELQRWMRLDRRELTALIQAGACDSFHAHRRALLYQAHELTAGDRPADPRLVELPDPPLDLRLPRQTLAEQMAGEWEALGFALAGHPMRLRRPWLERHGIRPIEATRDAEPGTRFRVAGLVMRPHRPPTRTGRNTLFFDLEDETGLISVTCFRDVYQADGQIVLRSPAVMVAGRIDHRTGRSLLADRIRPLPDPDEAALVSPNAKTLY